MAKLVEESRVALCPECERPHHFVQVRFAGGVNDAGQWQVRCGKCSTGFLIPVTNPHVSKGEFQPLASWDEEDTPPTLPSAKSVIIHNIPKSDYAPEFDLAAAPLFQCSQSGANLEPLATAALAAEIADVQDAYATAQNHLLGKRAFSGRFAVAQPPVTCSCGRTHVATFYTAFPAHGPAPSTADYLLADVSGADLEDRLEGVMSKSEVMELLSKLLVRWHLSCERVIVASPFVGHQWDKAEAKADRWGWLLAQLDPDRATLITRPQTLSTFRSLKDGDITYDLLKRLGLENKIISANVKKQDFHAKFFIGLGRDKCEVLSGSANLVHGPSVENITFRRMDRARCDLRYLEPMNLTLPAVKPWSPQHVRLTKNATGKWIASDASGWPFPPDARETAAVAPSQPEEV
jgi:hypothetical protein